MSWPVKGALLMRRMGPKPSRLARSPPNGDPRDFRELGTGYLDPGRAEDRVGQGTPPLRGWPKTRSLESSSEIEVGPLPPLPLLRTPSIQDTGGWPLSFFIGVPRPKWQVFCTVPEDGRGRRVNSLALESPLAHLILLEARLWGSCLS